MLDNPAFNPAASEDSEVQPLTDPEIKAFLDDLDHNGDGYIDYSEVESKLDAVHTEIQLEPGESHLHRDSQDDAERHAFLRAIIGSDESRINRDEFERRVREWRIPSLKQEKEEEESQDEYMRRIGMVRRLRAYWAVHGPTIVFLALVIGSMLGMGIWQMVKYLQPQYRGALGWGVVVAKTSAGILYPTLFFLLLSMSRYFSTLLRRSYRISRFINWDLSQEFHIYLAIWATFLGTLHGIAHLSGDLIWIANSYRPEQLDALLGSPAVREDAGLRTYPQLISSLPGITGILALACFYIIGSLSTPWVRRKNYEIFQLGHLLMYPIIGLPMAHGTKRTLQYPMLGFWLAFPTFLILLERLLRVFHSGFYRFDATIRILDSETVEIKVNIPPRRIFRYAPGQYCFLQVPELSFFQWHPFTISVCHNRCLQLNIKTDGNFTGSLRKLANGSEETPIKVGIDGPYGAPAERFHDFSHSILVGAGIGVTPFSGILADLQAKDNMVHGGPDDRLVGGTAGRNSAPRGEMAGMMNEKGRRDYEGYGSRRGSRDYDGYASRRGSADTSDRTVRDNAHPVAEKARPPAPTDERYSRRNCKNSCSHNPLRRVASTASNLAHRSGTRHRNRAPEEFASDYRRVDFHWIVRDKNNLSWFSDLLNSISRSQLWHHQNDDLPHPHLDIRIQTHVTQKRTEITTHVYRWLLELHRTERHPESPLTGLINSTHFGRPDFVQILDAHYDDMLRYRAHYGFDRDHGGDINRFKVGVFFCGTPMVGEMIADRCRLLTARGQADGTRIEYYFMMEVFG